MQIYIKNLLCTELVLLITDNTNARMLVYQFSVYVAKNT